ncbi:hypothetical protein BLNAU_1853 [Blattamonas nauphoetae]|uniref:Uncharacterized protein n=1 Tax=Blattamonas nauphoetae TaxID=2049346 RepID=A0ABQ9YIA7_9EUKA|nr:hypothetical protein BLNAU_1853 [Blattamonas nauphoetae]
MDYQRTHLTFVTVASTPSNTFSSILPLLLESFLESSLSISLVESLQELSSLLILSCLLSKTTRSIAISFFSKHIDKELSSIILMPPEQILSIFQSGFSWDSHIFSFPIPLTIFSCCKSKQSMHNHFFNACDSDLCPHCHQISLRSQNKLHTQLTTICAIKKEVSMLHDC